MEGVSLDDEVKDTYQEANTKGLIRVASEYSGIPLLPHVQGA